LGAVILNPNVRKTKRVLRLQLRRFKKTTTYSTFKFYNRYSYQIYQNSLIQNFFEFSLFYSNLKNISLSFEQAKSLYKKFSSSLLNANNEILSNDEKEWIKLGDFMSSQMPVLEHQDLFVPNKVGRPLSKKE
jgi:hypothetical protein